MTDSTKGKALSVTTEQEASRYGLPVVWDDLLKIMEPADGVTSVLRSLEFITSKRFE